MARASVEAFALARCASSQSQWCRHLIASPLPHRELILRPLNTCFSAQFSSAAAEASPTQLHATSPELPLCERPVACVTQLTSLLRWREQAAQRAVAAGTVWAGERDAPSVEDLHTELKWLLDDAVAGIVVPIDCNNENSNQNFDSWRGIERALAADQLEGEDSGGYDIQLRQSLEDLDMLWARRVEDRVPLQYLTSCAFWRDLVLSVGPGVLIPRPETELMIDFVEEAVETNPSLAQGAWADLGTGSGALAIGVARAVPAAPKVWAVDLAAEPAAHAAFNAARAGVEQRVAVLRGSWYEPLRAAGVGSGGLAGIVSNPPYISSDLVEGLQAEVGWYEPETALVGGPGLGIDALAPICCGAAEMLRPGGFLALETAGGEQAEYVAQLLRHMRTGGGEAPAFEDVRVRRDLRGVDRFVTASRTRSLDEA